MVKIIGHRGAKGLEQENTLPSFQRAVELGVDAVELDVQATKDGQFVVIHDHRLGRVSASEALVADISYSELSQIVLHNGTHVPLLSEVLTMLRGMPVILDIKIHENLPELFELLDGFSDMDITLASKWQSNMPEFKRLRPHLPALCGELYYLPVGPLRYIKRRQADGIVLFYIWMNPFTYWAAKKYNMQILIYTVDRVWVAKILAWLYPDALICTNRPDKLVPALRGSVTPR